MKSLQPALERAHIHLWKKCLAVTPRQLAKAVPTSAPDKAANFRTCNSFRSENIGHGRGYIICRYGNGTTDSKRDGATTERQDICRHCSPFVDDSNADRILVIEDGGIIEQGRHSELIALGGRYHKLYAQQSIVEFSRTEQNWQA